MPASGWVSIHRGLLDHDLWLSEKFSRGQAWIDLILLANHKEGFFRCRGVQIKVKRGQCGYGSVALAKRWKWSRGKVNRFLKELENDSRIIQQKNNVTTLITITKYDEYQIKRDSKRTANGQQTDTNNNDNKNNNKTKKEKPAKKPPEIIYPPELNQKAWQEYITYRREARIRKLTAKGEVKQIEKIIRYGNKDIQQQCIDQTIANGWQGVFPPKNQQPGHQSSSDRFLKNVRDNWRD